MNKLLLISILFIFFRFPLVAQTGIENHVPRQDDGEIKTLFKKPAHPVKLGYYISTESAYTQFDGKDVFIAGLSTGVILNHFFSIGLGANGVLNPGNLWYDNIQDSAGAYLYGGYGGVKLEFSVLPAFPVHLNFPVLIGGGGMMYNTWMNHYKDNDNFDGTTLVWDAFFVVEPGVMVELNLVKFVRIDAGISYRYAPDLRLVNTPNGLINNFNAKLSLKFGKF